MITTQTDDRTSEVFGQCVGRHDVTDVARHGVVFAGALHLPDRQLDRDGEPCPPPASRLARLVNSPFAAGKRHLESARIGESSRRN
jgi:hypothetical protein